MMAIKPGIFNICTKQYNKQMILEYLTDVRNKDVTIIDHIKEPHPKNKKIKKVEPF